MQAWQSKWDTARVSRSVLPKAGKEDISAWKQDLANILQIFYVRSIGPVRHSQLDSLLSDRAAKLLLPEPDGDGTRVDGTGTYFPPKLLGRCGLMTASQ